MTKKVERGFDRNGVGLDLQQLVDRLELLVDLSSRLGVALAESTDHRLDPRPRDVRVHTNTAGGPELMKEADARLYNTKSSRKSNKGTDPRSISAA